MKGWSEPWLKNFARRVREQRDKEGLSQQKFARKIGISRPYLSRIECAKAENLTLDMIDKVSVRLGLGRVKEAPGIYTAGGTEPGAEETLPVGLDELRQKLDLPEGDIALLLTLRFRGRKPQTLEQWEMAYNIIEAMSRVWLDTE